MGLKLKDEGEHLASIRSLDARDDLLCGYIFVPAEHMSELTSLAASGHLQIVHTSGTLLRYRHASVRSVNVTTSFDVEEW